MILMYTIIALILLISGGTGLLVTLTSADFGTTVMIQGTLTFGTFLLISLIIIGVMLTVLFEGD